MPLVYLLAEVFHKAGEDGVCVCVDVVDVIGTPVPNRRVLYK